MRIVLLLTFVFVMVAFASKPVHVRDEAETLALWHTWKKDFSRTYTASEESQKFANFKENLDIIARLNKQYNPITYFGTNQFSDMTNKEFQQFVRNQGIKKPSSSSKLPVIGRQGPISKKDIPASVDWRTKGAVTPISNQQQCGSSPYFSAVTSIEGAWQIAGNKLIPLSVQQVLDCSGEYGNMGCDGGLMNASITYVAKYGLETNATYPYTGVTDDCTYDKTKTVAHVKGFIECDGSEDAMTAALTIAPVSTAMDASSYSFQNYQSGVYIDTECSADRICHGIASVGYGVDSNGIEYYILKNTWGTTWGINGYMLIARNHNNMCGIASSACYAVVN